MKGVSTDVSTVAIALDEELVERLHVLVATGAAKNMSELVEEILGGDPSTWRKPGTLPAKHNHAGERTKPFGECPACDEYILRHAPLEPCDPSVASTLIVCACCKGTGCRRPFVWRNLKRCGCPPMVARFTEPKATDPAIVQPDLEG